MFSLSRGFKPSLMRKIWSHRSFGALVHLPAKEAIQHCDAQAAITAKWEQEHEEYNKFANAEYDTMISNRLSNIIDSGSVQDWELAEDNAFLRKTFTFETQDHSHFFVNEVSKFCSEHDHHPEWNMVGNNQIEVFLTSHFANNTVSLSDYELAQQMNKLFIATTKHNTYSYFTPEKSIEIGVVLAVFIFGLGIRKITSQNHEISYNTTGANNLPEFK